LNHLLFIGVEVLLCSVKTFALVHVKLQPLIVRGIATSERTRRGEQLDKLFNVHFNVTEDVVFENGEEIFESQFITPSE